MAKKNNEFFQLEGLQTVSILNSIIGTYLDKNGKLHPSIYNKRCKELLETAYNSLAELYQAIGEWEDPKIALEKRVVQEPARRGTLTKKQAKDAVRKAMQSRKEDI